MTRITKRFFYKAVYSIVLFWVSITDVRAQGESEYSVTLLPDSREYLSESWSIENGLPVNHITQVYQTPNGYLWLATFNGLVRFDGVTFRNYHSGNTPNLPSNRLILIQKGFGNAFWITSEQGDLIRVEDGSFQTFDLEPDQWFYIYPDKKENVIWVGSKSGLYLYTGGELVPSRVDLFGNIRVTGIFRQLDGTLWIFTDSQITYRFNGGNINEQPERLESMPEVLVVTEDSEGKVWVARNSIGYFVDDNFHQLDLDPGYTNYINPGQALFSGLEKGTGGRLFIYSQIGAAETDGSAVTIIEPEKHPEYLSLPVLFGHAITTCIDGSVWTLAGNKVYRNNELQFTTSEITETIYCDLENNIWITKPRRGLHRYRQSLFHTVTFPFSDNNFYGIYRDSFGGIWIGRMFSEITRVTSSGTIERIDVQADWQSTGSFTELNDGSMLLGSYMCRAENRTNTGGCTNLVLIEGLRGRYIRALHQDREGILWVGTSAGFTKIAINEEGETEVVEEIMEREVRFILETTDGDIWLATNGAGVLRFHKGVYSRYDTKNGLSSNNIRVLFQDEKGDVWVGSEDRGLNRIKPASGRISAIRSSDGLYDDGLHTMMQDGNGRIWFSTNQGIFWVEMSHLQQFVDGDRSEIISISYTERDGMMNREANGGFQNSGMRTPDGRLWFATQEGILVVNPYKIEPDGNLKKVIIEEIRTGETLLQQQAEGGIELSSDQKSFSIIYNSPSFTAPGRIRFRYKLEGFDDDWVDAGFRREAFYTNVPAGEYRFKVSAYYDRNHADMNITEIEMAVAPMFYETIWFPLLMLLLIGLVAGGGYKIRMRQLLKREYELEELVKKRTEDLSNEKLITEKQAEQLKQLSYEKNRLFANISHEFRTPLTLTIGPLQDLYNGLHGHLSAEVLDQIGLGIQNSKRLLRLVNQLMDLSRLENKKVGLVLKAGNLNQYLKTIAKPFQYASVMKKITFHLLLPESPLFAMFDPGHFDKVVGNLISNAIKFTPENGTVTLHAIKDGDNIKIAVKDTGPGIDPDHQEKLFDRFYQVQKSELLPGTGIGLSIAKELAELHGGSLSVESEVGNGSTFTVQIPALEPEEKVPGMEFEEIQPSTHLDNLFTMDVADLPAPANNGIEESMEHDNKTILIADDHPEIRSYLRKHLEGQYQIVEASTGSEAIDIVKAKLPDLIVSDVMMPDGDGFDLLKKIRSNPETSYLPVILLTARAEAEDKLSGLDIGADDYITKPFQIQEVLARIRNLFNQHKRLLDYIAGMQQTGIFSTLLSRVEVQESIDVRFLEQVQQVILEHLGDEEFSVEQLADKTCQSRSNLHRKLKDLTGESPGSLIRNLRLEMGAQMLRRKSGSVSEIAYSCGFKSVAHFSSLFSSHFGKSPTAYIAAMVDHDGSGNRREK
ncbi:MAG: hybrid sensor histidine kinase/response regulator [Balneolaceae bacterium]|nr:MAG: hybrid sensor histidine kinase/response regulator [Balneolaceae bacterium]